MPGALVNANALLNSGFNSLQSVDYTKLFEIAKKVKETNGIDAFAADPVGYSASCNGFVPPSGFHMHIADSNNTYHPKEDDALTQLSAAGDADQWTRVEVRAGYADIACIICWKCRSAGII